MSNEYSCQTRGLTHAAAVALVAHWYLFLSYILALTHLTCTCGRRKLISLHTLRKLCFSTVILQSDEKARKKSLHCSFLVVAFLWSVVILIVALNIDANGAYRFYGPTGYCKPGVA